MEFDTGAMGSLLTKREYQDAGGRDGGADMSSSKDKMMAAAAGEEEEVDELLAAISASGGAIRSLPRKLDSLLSEPKYGLQQAEKDEIGLLKHDLEELISSYLIEPSEVQAPALTAERWVKEVRELSYDIDDFVDELFHDGANARISFARKTSRVKIARLQKKTSPRGWITAEITGFRTRVKEVIQRHIRYHLDKRTMRPNWGVPDEGQLPQLHLHGEEVVLGSMKELESKLLTDDGDGEQHKLKVVSITGFGGVGKTTLANQLYSHLRGRFECRAFVRTSRKPDMRRLLTNMLAQLRRHQPIDAWEVPDLINNIRRHLQDKKYFIIIDDLWTLSTWDIVSCALPDSNRCGRVLITTEVDIVAQACCGYKSNNIVTMKPLSDNESTELFLSVAFGHEHECSGQLDEVSCAIIRKCGGLPLAVITIASLLASQRDRNVKQYWNYIHNSMSFNLGTNPTLEGMKQVLNLSYNNLPQRLKACMLYLSIYQEDYIISTDDLVKQWIAEGFISEVEGKDMEEVAERYFNELINMGMIQPVDINYNGDVLSCTVHYMVLNLIRYKSIEENFITTIDHSQTAIRLADKVRRLSLHFGNEEDATPPANMRLSQVRSLAFSGFFKCMPSITEFKLLRVLILKLWVDHDDTIYNLNEISKLFRLRYLYIDACHLSLELPTEMQLLKDLVTLKIDAKVSEVPLDIVHLHGLFHLYLPGETNLPDSIGHMASLRTLAYYNLSSNSEDNVLNLGKLTNLRYLCLTCSTVLPNNLESNMQHLGSILGKLGNLKSLILNTLDDAGVTGMSISCDGLSSMSVPPALLERLEFSRRVCTFSSLPSWIGKLNKLCILKIAVRELLRNDINILKGLPALTALSLYALVSPLDRIVFDGAGFQILKYFKFVCTAPCLAFIKGAMPNVRRLKLGFNANRMEQYNPKRAGFEHLTGLKEISAKIGGACADAESVLITAVSKHASNPKINVQLVDWKFYGDEDRSMSRREQKHLTPEEQDEILEKHSYQYFGTQDEDPREVEKKQADSRISTWSKSSSRLSVGGSDADSALAIAVSSHPRNPRVNVQGRSMVTKEKQYGTLEEHDEIHEEDPHKHYGTQDGESGEDENKQAGSMARREQEHGTLVDQDEIMEDDPDEDSGEDENKQTGIRISTLPESSSHLPVPELKKDESLFGKMAEMVRKGGMEALPGAVQMVTGDGTYRAADVERFIGSCKELSAPRTPYTVVSILGPQSSGKSFLLNCLFGTDFGVMDGAKGRRKTTKGIWLAKCIHPSFLVMDVEGSDGRERGEDDTSFEKQTALFALVVSDLILVNMWVHDIGRLQGGSIPLLKLIFKERTKLEPHKTRMVIVIRDYDYETSEEILKKHVVATLNEIWRSVDCGNIRKLSDYISLSVMIFPPKREELKFEERCAVLREWLATGSLAGLRQNKVPAFGFSFSAESIWETVRQNEQLNLPSHNKLVAYMLCSTMKSKKLASLESDENFLTLTGDTPACPKDFLIIMEKLVEPILNDFDAGTEGLDETVADETRKELVLQILQLLEPACEIMLKKLSCAILVGSMKKISSDLKDTDHPTQWVDTVIRPFLDIFDDQCRDLKLKYGTSVAEHRATLASRLDTFAREKARKIERAREIKVAFSGIHVSTILSERERQEEREASCPSCKR